MPRFLGAIVEQVFIRVKVQIMNQHLAALISIAVHQKRQRLVPRAQQLRNGSSQLDDLVPGFVERDLSLRIDEHTEWNPVPAKCLAERTISIMIVRP
jgi:hypothetical protein